MKKGDRKERNDFTCVAWKSGAKVNFMRFVHSVATYRKWLSEEGIDWDYINVYWRRSMRFKERIYRR